MSLLASLTVTGIITLRCLWIGPWPPQIDTVQTFWPNGLLKSEYFLLNHSEEEGDSNWTIVGWHQTWHENGQLHEQLLYDDGTPQGFYTAYHPNGRLKEQGEMSSQKHGVWIRWYDSGEREEETVYPILGCYSKQRGWFRDGKPKFEVNGLRNKYHGHCFWAKSDDTERLNGFFFEGVMLVDLDSLVGWHQFYQRGEYYNQQYDIWVVWDEAMSNVWVGKKVNGVRTGRWTHFLPNGEIVVEDY